MAALLNMAALLLFCITMAAGAGCAHADSNSASDANVLKLVVDENGSDDGVIAATPADAPADVEPRAYAQWVAFHISYSSASAMNFLSINNSALPWGKWYAYPDKSKEISGPDGTSITYGQIAIVAACGRSNSPSGTEGTFELYANGVTKLAQVYFDCPWSGKNVLRVTSYTSLYFFDYPSISTSGAIGDISLKIYARG